MFDDEYGETHMFHSTDCHAAGQGVDVTFLNPITLVDFIIHARKDCCRERYLDVCLYADGEKIACTPSVGYIPGDVINFMDFRITGTSDITASSFKIQWDGVPQCAQIEELFIDYTGETHTYLNFLITFKRITDFAVH